MSANGARPSREGAKAGWRRLIELAEELGMLAYEGEDVAVLAMRLEDGRSRPDEGARTVSLREAAELAGMSYQTAATRAHLDKAPFKGSRKVNGAWRVPFARLCKELGVSPERAFEDAPAKRCRRGIAPAPVRCAETGEVFTSVKDAARALGMKEGTLRSAIKARRPVRGLHLAFAPRAKGPFASVDGSRAADLAASAVEHSPVASPCRCVETGKVYASRVDAAKELGLNRSSVSRAVRTGSAAAGFHFVGATIAELDEAILRETEAADDENEGREEP